MSWETQDVLYCGPSNAAADPNAGVKMFLRENACPAPVLGLRITFILLLSGPLTPCSPDLKPQSMAPCLPWPLAAPGPTALFPGPVPHSCLLQASSTPDFGNNSTLDPRTSKTGCSITSLLAPPALTWPTGPRCCEFSWGFLNLSPGP